MNRHDPDRSAESQGDDAPGRITPMMAQYIEIRAANPDCLLFYRMGDFYELFFEDAATASRALGIALTKRGKHLGEDIAMCGVPVHAADEYLQKLIAQGYRVAVCEQVEDPAEARRRGAKSVVRRAVTRLVTPGTLTEDSLLQSRRNNFLAALARVPASDGEHRFAVAWADISTGEFRVSECDGDGVAALLARIEPREVLVSERIGGDPAIGQAIAGNAAAVTPLPPAFFDGASAEARLCAAFGVKTLDGFGSFSRAEIAAAAALIAYVDKTQIAQRPPMEPPQRVAASAHMRLDAATRANLELFRTLSGETRGALLHAIDRTRTSAGSRLLAARIANPLCDPAAIEARLDEIEAFLDDAPLRRAMADALAAVPDMPRALSRIGLDRGGPRDLAAIRDGLQAANEIAAALAGAPAVLRRAAEVLRGAPHRLAATLKNALGDALPFQRRDGGFIRPSFDARLDEARSLRDESRRIVATLQARYADETGIRGLKIRHNNVLGYFVEVNATQGQSLLADARFIHRQTLVSAMRFSSAELAELDRKIANAAEEALRLELEIFDALAAAVMAEQAAIRAAAAALAELDVACSLAELAAAESYCRPKVDRSLAFRIEHARHPVVEQVLKREGQSFVGNDCDLGPEPAPGSGDTHRPAGEAGHVWLMTGPNMAGKSTFLRQNALIAILAQSGSFVPARAAHIGIVDAVFSRVGAADDLARGRSTFMVEMVETAAILNQAGPRGLVILDEIGRGTATFDGLSIAWATIEHLHDVNRCRTLFATHYHELTALAAKLPRLRNATMRVKEWKGDVVFLHEVVPGAADRSYGIQVAKLAGLPKPVIGRARQVLESLERSDRSRPKLTVDDLPLFAARPAEPAGEAEAASDPALAALAEIEPDELSPRQALEALYALKRLVRG